MSYFRVIFAITALDLVATLELDRLYPFVRFDAPNQSLWEIMPIHRADYCTAANTAVSPSFVRACSRLDVNCIRYNQPRQALLPNRHFFIRPVLELGGQKAHQVYAAVAGQCNPRMWPSIITTTLTYWPYLTKSNSIHHRRREFQFATIHAAK